MWKGIDGNFSTESYLKTHTVIESNGLYSLASQTYFDVPYYDVDWGLAPVVLLVLVPSPRHSTYIAHSMSQSTS